MSDERRPIPPATDATVNLPPKKIDDHWCMHPGCKLWGSFGYDERYGTVWYCGEHRPR